MDHLFNSKVNIVRPTKVSDGKGSFTVARQTLYANLPCRINWSRGLEKLMFGRETYYRDAKIYCRVVDIGVKDIAVIDSVDYDIVNVSNVDSVGKYLILDVRLTE